MDIMKQFTPEQFETFFLKYQAREDKAHYRLGQAFMNEMLPEATDPEIFYETNAVKARWAILKKYVIGYV